MCLRSRNQTSSPRSLPNFLSSVHQLPVNEIGAICGCTSSPPPALVNPCGYTVVVRPSLEWPPQESDSQPLSIAAVKRVPTLYERVRPALGYIIAVAALFWVFRDIKPAKLVTYITTVKPGWVLLAIVFDIATYI